MPEIVAREVYSSSPFSFGGQLAPQVTPQVPEVDDNLIEETEAPTPQRPAAPTTPSPNDNAGYDFDDADENYEEDEFDEQSPLAPQRDEEGSDVEIDHEEAVISLKEAFKSLGFLEDDKELGEVKSVSDFLVNYEKFKASKIEEAIKEDYKNTYSEEKLKYIDFLMNGGDPQAISSFYTVANLSIDDEVRDRENIKGLILAMHKDRGLNDKKALTLYNTAYDEGDDLNEAREAKAYFKKKHDGHVANLAAQRESERQEVIKQNDKIAENLREMIKSRKLEGVDLHEDEAKELETYMFSKNVIADIDDPETGQPFKGKVSQYYIEYQNFMSKPDSLIKLARFIKSNGKIEDQKEKVKEEINRELIVKLNGFRGGARGANQSTRKNAFLNK